VFHSVWRVAVEQELLPDSKAADEAWAAWRERFGALKPWLEA
jgi:hypothetical protein